MSDGAGQVIYSTDTNALMDWQARFYPTDVFKGLVVRMADLVDSGQLQAAALVREELEAVGTPELVGWAKSNAGIFVPTKDLLAGALAIQNQFPGLRDPKAEYEEADAYVISLARCSSSTGSRPAKRRGRRSSGSTTCAPTSTSR